MTDAEKREAARQFYYKWKDRGKEDEDDRSYWFDLLNDVMGMERVTDNIDFQKKVIVDGHTKRIDAYIPETKVLIEQKSKGIPLDKPITQSGGIELTPYEQAKRYNDNLPFEEKARWIVTSNFGEIWIYDMNAKVPEPVKLELADLQTKYSMLDFLINQKTKKINVEMEVSLKAGELVGKMYDAFLAQYDDTDNPEVLKSLNKLCVRIVFCLYAEDAGLFGRKNLFHDYMEQYDAKGSRKALIELFKVLDQKEDERDKYLKDDDPLLAEFPYVNGGLFADEDIEIPPLSDDLRNIILQKASDGFDWSLISPTIFGAVFESTLNPETRRSGGMHYTSIENIHKVIDPLFLDGLKDELNEIQGISVYREKKSRLEKFQEKLSGLTWLDPACGSGNFLTETYISIRRLENEVIKEKTALEKGQVAGQISLGFEEASPIRVSISQFYGIEINDFAVTVAKTALWIAESQMMKETEDIVHMNLDFLPLKTNAHIVEANALRIDWNEVVSKERLNYIMGNPPFAGRRYRTKAQICDVEAFFKYKDIDYVACWYKKAAQFIQNSKIKCAFVSTNSITQGEQVAALWQELSDKLDISIEFAYRTFRWDSEANIKAHVHCVIIGFCLNKYAVTPKKLYFDNQIFTTENINGYLLPAPNVFLKNRSVPLCNVPKMKNGNVPLDGDALKIEAEDLSEFENCKQYVKRLMGGRELLHNEKRYVLWLVGVSPNEIKKYPQIYKRVDQCRKNRLAMKDKGTQKLASAPTLFRDTNNPSKYIALPMVSSERRRYIPIDYLDEKVIPTNQIQTIPDAELYHFGVLTSNIHNAWMRAVCGRLEMRYRYSKDIVYNNFPWCNPTFEQKAKIEKTAQGILDARALYPDSSLADLYDELTMPPELRKAHTANDIAVMQAYGFNIKEMSESDCVAELMKMYQKLVDENG